MPPPPPPPPYMYQAMYVIFTSSASPGGGLGGGGEVGEHGGVIPPRTPGGQPSHGGRDTAMNIRSGLYGVTAGDKVHSMHIADNSHIIPTVAFQWSGFTYSS